MRSVRRRLSMPSTASLTWSGRLLRPGAPRARLRIDVPAELGGDDHLVPERRDTFAQDPLDLVRPVGLGGVEEGDTMVEGRPDDVEHLGPAGDRRLVGAAHVLDAEADARDLQRAQPSSPGRRRRRLAPRPCRLGCGLRLRAAEKRHRRETSHRPHEPTTTRFEPALFSHVSMPSSSSTPAWFRYRRPRRRRRASEPPRTLRASSSGSPGRRGCSSICPTVPQPQIATGTPPAG